MFAQYPVGHRHVLSDFQSSYCSIITIWMPLDSSNSCIICLGLVWSVLEWHLPASFPPHFTDNRGRITAVVGLRACRTSDLPPFPMLCHLKSNVMFLNLSCAQKVLTRKKGCDNLAKTHFCQVPHTDNSGPCTCTGHVSPKGEAERIIHALY